MYIEIKFQFEGATIYEIFIFAWTRTKTRQLEQRNKRNESIEKQCQFEFIKDHLNNSYFHELMKKGHEANVEVPEELAIVLQRFYDNI